MHAVGNTSSFSPGGAGLGNPGITPAALRASPENAEKMSPFLKQQHMRSVNSAARTMTARSNEFHRKAKHRLAQPQFAAYAAALDCLAGVRCPLLDPIGSNGLARWALARSIFRACRKMQRQDSALQFGWNTIIHQGWETSDEITEVRVFQIQTDTRSTLTDMGLGFLRVRTH